MFLTSSESALVFICHNPVPNGFGHLVGRVLPFPDAELVFEHMCRKKSFEGFFARPASEEERSACEKFTVESEPYPTKKEWRTWYMERVRCSEDEARFMQDEFVMSLDLPAHCVEL